METQELKSIVEALIFAADEPLSEARIRETLELENGFDFNSVINALNQEYQDSGRSFTIRKIAGGYQIVTQQNYASWIKKLYLGRQKNRLSHAALETLALIAFKQPISRVDIGQIRGVNSDGVIGTLLERKLITISGRSEAVGRPLLYSTTPEFLKYFGINDITDLPKPREIEELFSKEGMPEELLQALSQTDAQLSLPMTTDGETPAAPEEIENKNKKIDEAPINTEAPAVTETLNEVDDTVVSENVAAPGVEAAVGADETAVLAPPIAGVDINEKVVTQLEVAGEVVDTPIITSVPEEQNEIAWISLNSEADAVVEEAPTDEPLVDELIETANELPTFAGVAEVAQEQMAARDEVASEELTETADDLPTFAGVTEVAAAAPLAEPAPSNELPLERLAEPVNEIPTFANVEEVVSHTLTGDEAEAAAKLAALEAMTDEVTADLVRTDAVTSDRDEVAESSVAGVDEVVALVAEPPATEVQVVEAYDVGLTDRESPPLQQSEAAMEVDGWLADDAVQEEIAEPDFMKKSGDFFLEEEPQSAIDLMAAIDAAPSAEAEPIVVSNTELASIADAAFLNFEDAEPETASGLTPPADELVEIVASEKSNLAGTEEIAAANNLAAPEPAVDVAIVDFPEPTIITAVPEVSAKVIDPVVAEEKLAPTQLDAVSASEKLVTAAAPEAAREMSHWPDDETTAASLPASKGQAEIDSAPAITVEPAVKHKAASPEGHDSLPSTLRARVVGWFKRTFNKLLALIGATGENE